MTENSATYDTDFDTTWDGLIRNLASKFFVINNVEKVSRIMNVSFSASDPNEFVDCGVTTRSFKSGSGKAESFSFANAARTIQFKTTDDNNVAWFISNTQTLEGRANIYVAPNGFKTDVTVNVRYTMMRNVQGTPLHAIYGTAIGPTQTLPTQPLSFDTGSPGTEQAAGGNITCTTNGKLERMILDAAARS